MCIPSQGGIEIGRIASMELNHKPVDRAKQGESVAMKIEPANATEATRLYGRHFDFKVGSDHTYATTHDVRLPDSPMLLMTLTASAACQALLVSFCLHQWVMSRWLNVVFFLGNTLLRHAKLIFCAGVLLHCVPPDSVAPSCPSVIARSLCFMLMAVLCCRTHLSARFPASPLIF